MPGTRSRGSSTGCGCVAVIVVVVFVIAAAVIVYNIGFNTIATFFGLGNNALVPPPSVGEVQVHFIDVGQGSAALILTDDTAILIDAGDNHAADTVVDYIRRMSVNRLCLIIATHPHADHIGGMDRVISEIGADRIMKPVIADSFLPDTATLSRKLYAIADNDIEPFYATVGYVVYLSEEGCTYLEILGPAGCFGDNVNNHSIIVRLVHGENSFLFTGDVERAGEECLLERRVDLSADVLKVSHHGSRTSSSRAFLEAVNVTCDNTPTYAVISVGSPNRHNHPTDEVLNRLEVTGFDVLRTDVHGSIIFVSTDDGGLRVYS
jgi:competence protein ComEC